MVNNWGDASAYSYSNSELGCAHQYLLPRLSTILENELARPTGEARLFDLGCGNGSVAAYFADRGFDIVGVDPSSDGIAAARAAHPSLRFDQGSAYDDLRAIYGQFPIVISLEVVEHVYSPRNYAHTLFDLVGNGGVAVVSTPYHGYLKNLAVAVSNKFDVHVNPLWDNGHIKFWSRRTLTKLFQEVGFEQISYHRVGRVPALAKSMIAVARKH